MAIFRCLCVFADALLLQFFIFRQATQLHLQKWWQKLQFSGLNFRFCFRTHRNPRLFSTLRELRLSWWPDWARVPCGIHPKFTQIMCKLRFTYVNFMTCLVFRVMLTRYSCNITSELSLFERNWVRSTRHDQHVWNN